MNSNPAEEEPGPPIQVLAGAEHPVSDEFIGRVRRTIFRRTAVSQLASYSWHIPKLILMEMASMFGHILKASANNKEQR